MGAPRWRPHEGAEWVSGRHSRGSTITNIGPHSRRDHQEELPCLAARGGTGVMCLIVVGKGRMVQW